MYHGQVLQDKILNERVFKNRRGGFFVDIGAHDGVTFSNSLFFERELGWQGICIEPLPDIYQKLVQNRRCETVRGCAYNQNGIVKFNKVTGYAEMLSGITTAYPPEHLDRISREIVQHGGTQEVVSSRAFRLEDILDLYAVRHVNYLSIDTEGAEFEVIQGINFQKVTFDIIQFEENYENVSVPIQKYLSERGYTTIGRIGGDILVARNELAKALAQPAPSHTNGVIEI